MKFVTKKGDTRVAIEGTLDPVKGPVGEIDKVNFRMMNEAREGIIDREVNITDLPKVTFVFIDHEMLPGRHKGEFVATYIDGREETFPNWTYIDITILDNAEGS